jgi:hypothetical protein
LCVGKTVVLPPVRSGEALSLVLEDREKPLKPIAPTIFQTADPEKSYQFDFTFGLPVFLWVP